MYVFNRKTLNNQCTDAVIVDDSISVEQTRRGERSLTLGTPILFLLSSTRCERQILSRDMTQDFISYGGIGTLGVVKVAPEMPKKIDIPTSFNIMYYCVILFSFRHKIYDSNNV